MDADRPIVVFCATVPWRKPACDAMLRSIAEQTVKPDLTILHLDGFTRDDPRTTVPDALPVEQRELWPRRGLGARWRSLSGDHAAAIVMGVDDDFVYAPNYVARTVQERRRFGGAVSWHGWGTDWSNVCFPYAPRAPTALLRLGTGFLCARAADLIGIDRHPLADVFFNPKGHEEALVSFWFWKHGVKMTRPAGPAPLVRVHELAYDDRATSKSFAQEKAALRRKLYEDHGWPGGLR